MNTSKLASLGRLIPSILSILCLFFSGCATHREIFSKTIVDSIEEITVYTDSGPVIILANIDSGAENPSIDAGFVEQYGLKPYVGEKKSTLCPNSQIRVKNSLGFECRRRVIFKFMIKGVFQDSVATIADRSDLSTPALIGNNALTGFLIRPLVASEERSGETDEAEEESD